MSATIRIGERTFLVASDKPLEPGCPAALVRDGKRTVYGRWWPAQHGGEFSEFDDYLASAKAMKKPFTVPQGASVVRIAGVQIVEPFAADHLPSWSGPGPGAGPADPECAATC